MINRVCGRGGGPPDFRNFSDKSPNHLVYSPTIAPPAPQSWRPPLSDFDLTFCFDVKRQYSNDSNPQRCEARILSRVK